MDLSNMSEDYTELSGHVYVGKDHPEGWIPADWTDFKDIGEDLQGFDVMSFKWKGKSYSSRIINRPR
jgi:hypothetical protein